MSDPIPFPEFKKSKKKTAAPESDPRPPEFSDDAIADKFAARHASDMRYVHTLGKWFQWTGTHWAEDNTLLAFNRAREVCRSTAPTCGKEKVAAAVASGKTIAAVEKLAKADRRIAATIEQWDANAWLLNTPAGTVDLKTGQLRAHDSADYLTKITAIGPGGDWELWHKFLDRVTDGDEELQRFYQRMAGYMLTGDTSAHALFFAYGRGANGKSVFTSTLAGILANYAKTAPVETFTASNTDRHPTDIAGLRGARLVTAVETEEGRRWAESRIKQLTGGDVVAARFMRGDFFEYRPTFKLLIAGNHKPTLRSVDEAMRRRMNLLPFTVTIPAEERDPELAEKLKAERGGILQWAIDGCLAWQREGLNPPAAVTEATAEYLEAEDALAAWIDERCEIDPQAWSKSSVLFANWKSWAESAGEYPGSNKRFAQSLEQRGYTSIRKNSGAGYTGLRIRDTGMASMPYAD